MHKCVMNDLSVGQSPAGQWKIILYAEIIRSFGKSGLYNGIGCRNGIDKIAFCRIHAIIE